MPLPPANTSAPLGAVPSPNESAPASPLRLSSPLLPARASLPSPPQILSLPPSPLIVSLPPRPAITSGPEVPDSVSSPAVPEIVTGDPRQVSGGGGGGGGSTGPVQLSVPARSACPSVLLSFDQKTGLAPERHSAWGAIAKPSLLRFATPAGRRNVSVTT